MNAMRALIFGMAMASSAMAVASPQTDSMAMVSGATTAAPAQQKDDATQYAMREQRAQVQKDYRGGDYLVVGISTGAAIIILLIVLILVA